MTVNVVARQEKMWYDTWADKAKVNMQRYRSGHNGADSKSVWSNPRGFESHPLRQKKARESVPFFSKGGVRSLCPSG